MKHWFPSKEKEKTTEEPKEAPDGFCAKELLDVVGLVASNPREG